MKADRVLPDSAPCPNCGDPTPGSYCRVCGQRRVARVLSLRRLIADAVEDQFSLNAALPRTLGLLFTHPGMLTQEFLRARIADYIPPFRLYLLTSFLFFLTMAIFGCNEDPASDEENTAEVADSIQTPMQPDSTADTVIAAQLAPPPAASDSAEAANDQDDEDFEPDSALLAEADSAAARARENVLDGARAAATSERTINQFFGKYDIPFEDRLRERIVTRVRLVNESDVNDIFDRELRERAPIVIFLLVPLFTAIMKLLYIRQGRFYVEHFVFALHVHSFLFFTLTLLEVLPEWWLANGLTMIWVVVYIFLSMRRVYQQSRLVTALKYVMLAFTYFVLGILAMAATMAYTFLFAAV
jgi:hypothetical protein